LILCFHDRYISSLFSFLHKIAKASSALVQEEALVILESFMISLVSVHRTSFNKENWLKPDAKSK